MASKKGEVKKPEVKPNRQPDIDDLDGSMKDFFISYSSDDKEIVHSIAEHLRQNSIPIWLDNRDLQQNETIPQQIRDALLECHTILLMWSINHHVSRWCRDEHNAAQRFSKRVIYCLLDDRPLPPDVNNDAIEIDFSTLALGKNDLLPRCLEKFEPKPFSHPKPITKQPVENLPFSFNKNFTGRTAHLTKIQAAFEVDKQAILLGLGGVGKTQIALHYIYQHMNEYKLIWWIRSEGIVTLGIDYADIAHALDLPEKNETEHERIVMAVKRWLEQNADWLIIFDKAESKELLDKFLPNIIGNGHILTTTRNDEWQGSEHVIDVDVWDRAESVEFLLGRHKENNASDADSVADILGDLPLALDQAAAYMITETIGFSDYVKAFETEQSNLIDTGELSTKYQDTVATTWRMALREISKQSCTAIEFLNMCAFMAPDQIPLALIAKQADALPKSMQELLGDKGEMAEMRILFKRYSIANIENDSLSMHRLVQVVIRYGLVDAQQKQSLGFIVEVMAKSFDGLHPQEDVNAWPTYKALHPHILICVKYAQEQEVNLERVGYLYNHLGLYLDTIGLYEQVESLYIKAVDIYAKVLGKEHPTYATSLNNLAGLYSIQAKHDKAEPLYIESRDITAKVLGKKHPVYATILNNLAELYNAQDQYDKAGPLYIESRDITAKVFGKEHPDYASSLNNLAVLYRVQGQYDKAEQLLIESRDIRAKVLGKEHPDYATSLNNLARLYDAQGQYDKAEPLYIESRDITDKVFGKEHPDYATSLNNLARLYDAQGQFDKVEPLYIESRDIRAKVLGKEHPNYATSLNNLAGLYRDQGQYDKAEPLYIESRNIRAKVLGKEHTDYAQSLNNLAGLYREQGQYDKAEPLYIESRDITAKVLGKEHPNYATSLNNLAGLYYVQGQYDKAEQLLIKSRDIRAKVFGKEHPDYATSLNNLAELYRVQAKYDKAEPLYIESRDIRSKILGKEHPSYAISLNNLAELYRVQGQYGKAEPLYIESRDIRARVLGKEHVDYANSLNNLAVLYYGQGQYDKAQPLYLEAIKILENVFGPDHPDAIRIRNNYELMLDAMSQKK